MSSFFIAFVVRIRAANTFSVAVLLALTLSVMISNPQYATAQSAPEFPLVTQSDFQYEGAFRLPAGSFGDSSTHYSEGPLSTMRAIQARASYLVWKIYGERLDGRSSEHFPKRSDGKDADLDFELGTCPASTLLTVQEKQNISRWIDMGSALDLEQEVEQSSGKEARTRQSYTGDSTIPVLTSRLREEGNQLILDYSAFDSDSGIEVGSFNVTVTKNSGEQATFVTLPLDPVRHTGGINLGISPADYPVTIKIEVRDQAGHKNDELIVYPPAAH